VAVLAAALGLAEQPDRAEALVPAAVVPVLAVVLVLVAVVLVRAGQLVPAAVLVPVAAAVLVVAVAVLGLVARSSRQGKQRAAEHNSFAALLSSVRPVGVSPVP
jgi:multisubunit Na+/H+ antiporter MnhG subunit